MTDGRDVWWDDIVPAPARATARPCRSTPSTCSTCSTPRGPRPSPRASCTPPRATCWATSYTHEMVFDVKPDDVYWCAADIGWVTGHSYIVYGPLANATTGVMYEGTPDTPGLGSLVVDHRGVQGHHPLLRADGDPGLHEAGRGAAAASTTSRSLRLLGSVGEPINPEAWLWYQRAHRRRALPDRGHLVADRDGHDPDHAAPRRHHHQARQCHVPVPRHRRRRRRCERRERAARRGRLPRPEAALAVHAARHLRRPGSLPRHVLGPLPGHVLRRRRRQARRRRLLLAARPRRRRHERRPGHRISTIEVEVGAGRPPRGGRGRGGRQERSRHRAGHLRLRHRSSRASRRTTRWPTSCASTSRR